MIRACFSRRRGRRFFNGLIRHENPVINLGMDLSSVLDWLYSTQLFGIKLGLEGTEKLLRAVDAFPNEQVKVLHVAGTNGKGSTCAMVETIAREGGVKTGLFTSPHLVDFRERIRVNGEMIPEKDLLRILLGVKEMVAAWESHPTFFELTLAIALCWFKEQEVQLLILETGLGGRLDATNAIPKDVAVLAPIGMDHQQYLGDTLAEIAGEKAGIIQPGKPVVSAWQESEAMAVIQQAASERGCALSVVSTDDSLQGLALAGAHQKANASLAIAALRAINLLPDAETVAGGLSLVEWRGRFEIDGKRVLDGAHNPHAAKVLVATWQERFGDERAAVVFAASADKQIQGVLELIAPLASEWYLPPCTSPRILPACEMSQLIQKTSPAPVYCCETLTEALERAEQSGRPVLVTGSLFLLGDVLALGSEDARRGTVQ